MRILRTTQKKKKSARLFTVSAMHRFKDTTKWPDISSWYLISIRRLAFQLPPSLAAPSDPPSAEPPSPETKHGKGNAVNNYPPPGAQILPAHHKPPGRWKIPVYERKKYLGDGGLDALVLHQLRHHRPAGETNPVRSTARRRRGTGYMRWCGLKGET